MYKTSYEMIRMVCLKLSNTENINLLDRPLFRYSVVQNHHKQFLLFL